MSWELEDRAQERALLAFGACSLIMMPETRTPAVFGKSDFSGPQSWLSRCCYAVLEWA